MRTFRLAALGVHALSIAFSGRSLAQDDPFSGCTVGVEETPVEPRDVGATDQRGLRFVAKARGGPPPRIDVNRDNYPWLSAVTKRWLYFRECAHIELKNVDKEITRSMHEEADCLALKWMGGFSRYDIFTIERDLERLQKAKEGWPTAQLGDVRPIDLASCP